MGGEEEKLPGLKYTPKQLFWISAAGNRCSKQRPQTMRLRMLTGSHSPGKVGDGDLEQHGGVCQRFPVPCWIQNEPTKEQEVQGLVSYIETNSAFVTLSHHLPLLFTFVYQCIEDLFSN